MKKYYVYLVALFGMLLVSGQSCLTLGGNSGPQTSGPAGMFVSTDKGEAWQLISSLPTIEGVQQLTGISVYKVFEDPQDIKALYWASRESGLLYSYDQGRSWRRSPSPFDQGFVYSLVVHPQDKCTIFATNGRQLFKSIDCVRSWEEMFYEARPGNNITAIAIDPFRSNEVYIGQASGEVLKSVDMGKNWSTFMTLKGDIRDIVFDPYQKDLVFVPTRESGLHRSRDAGATWTNLSDKLSAYPGGLRFRRLMLLPGAAEHIYWISEYGVLTSRNAGEEWEAINLVTPPGSVDIYGFAVNPKNDKEIYYTGTIDYKSTFYRSMNGGQSWETRKLPSKQFPTYLRVHPEETSWVYLGFTIPPSD